jgi:hypothetical protein
LVVVMVVGRGGDHGEMERERERLEGGVNSGEEERREVMQRPEEKWQLRPLSPLLPVVVGVERGTEIEIESD